jgi:hypothetical protein
MNNIEQFLTDNSTIKHFYQVSQIDETTFVYYIDFIDEELLDGIYDIKVNDDETITYLRHIRE